MKGKAGLEAVAIILHARIIDGDKPDALTASADIGYGNTKLF